MLLVACLCHVSFNFGSQDDTLTPEMNFMKVGGEVEHEQREKP